MGIEEGKTGEGKKNVALNTSNEQDIVSTVDVKNLQEQLLGKETRKMPDVKNLQEQLVAEAHRALVEVDFNSRNEIMTEAVAEETSLLTAESIGKPEIATELELVFNSACREAGQAFAIAFDERGSKIEGTDAEYKVAMAEAGKVAYEHLQKALEVCGLATESVDTLLKEATFDDILRLTAEQLEEPLPESKDLVPDQIKKSLHKSAAGDYYEKKIDSIPFADGISNIEDDDKRKVIDVATRLANATWKVGQVHRSAWEGNDSRIDPNKRDAFNPNDLLKTQLYEGEIAKGLTPEEALIRVAFEVYKDVLQFQKVIK